MDNNNFIENSVDTQKFAFTDDISDVITILKRDREGNKFIEMYFEYPHSTVKFHNIPIKLIRGEVNTSTNKISAKLTLNLIGDETNIVYSQEAKRFI